MKKILFIPLLFLSSFCKSSSHFVHDYSANLEDNLVNVVVEIPAGTHEKWEVNKSNGKIELEYKKNKPRIIKYLPYPFNYGMIARTLGGDGDPLDAIIIGDTIKRGSIPRVKIIGILKMKDKGEQDDKIITISSNSKLYNINSIDELKTKFPGVDLIIRTWFKNYKGKKKGRSKVMIEGFGNKDEANDIIIRAIDNYKFKEK